MKKANTQAGITLIALVVTIVVLLILAGITISFVLQSGGIFDAAQQAGNDTRIATVREYANNAIIAMYAECATTGASITDTQKFVKANFPADMEGTITAEATYEPASTGSASKIKITLTGNGVTINGAKYNISYDSTSDSVAQVTPVK